MLDAVEEAGRAEYRRGQILTTCKVHTENERAKHIRLGDAGVFADVPIAELLHRDSALTAGGQLTGLDPRHVRAYPLAQVMTSEGGLERRNTDGALLRFAERVEVNRDAEV